MPLLVEMRGIEKRFPGVYSLRGVDFDLAKGEVHVLMGENGAGKSTLMKILSGVYQKDSGTIKVNDKIVVLDDPKTAQNLGIGIIHQELSLISDLTVAQNIFIGREPRSSWGVIDEEYLNGQANDILKKMNFDIDPTIKIGSLTIAKQQMVEIAKALSYQSRVLIMDEPTAALNDAEIAELFVVIRHLKSEGVGIVYISHKMNEIRQIADRVTVLRDGEYVGTVDARSISLSKIILMMVGREIKDESVDIPDLSGQPELLEVKSLNRGKEIKGVSFSLKKGEVLGFAGLMGAGRTEVARAIFGADSIESGEVWVKGKQCHIKSPSDAVAAGIGYLSEDRKHLGLALGMDARANITMATLDRFANSLGMLNESEMSSVADAYIKQLGIRMPFDAPEVSFLSGGNQQKVVIAKWLLKDCDILIFDEPTRGIDVGAKSEIYKLLESLAKQGKAIIVISSELPEIMRLSHRIAVMCQGELTGILPGGKATNQEQIMALAT